MHSQRGRYDPGTGFPLAQVSPKSASSRQMQERPWEFCRESRKRAELPLLLLKLCRRRSGVSLDSTSLNDRNLLFTEDSQRRPQDFLSRGHSSKAREASKPSGKDRGFEHRKRCKSRQLYLPESLTKKLPQREGCDAGRSAVKAAYRHQDILSVPSGHELESKRSYMHSFTPLACFLLLLKFCFSSLCLTSARWKRTANSIAC